MDKRENLNSVAILGWADPRKGAFEGGGYNLVLQEHARYLVKNGDKVFHLRSGREYTLHWLLNYSGKPKIKRSRPYGKIKCYSLWNSRNRSPGIANFYNRDYQFEDSEQDALVAEWIRKNKITSVWIHSLEGHPLSLVKTLKEKTSARVEVFCHDHYFLCPEVNLLQKGAFLCTNGWVSDVCNSCISEKKNRKFEAGRAMEGARFLPLRLIRILYLGLRDGSLSVVESSETASRIPEDANEKYLKNRKNPGKPGSYYFRRMEMVRMSIPMADRVVSPSGFIAESLESAGVNGVEIIRLGLSHLDRLKSAVKEGAESLTGNRLVFCYRGSGMPHKGLSVFLDALKSIPEEIRAECGFLVRGVSRPSDYDSYCMLIPQLQVYGRYHPDDLIDFIHEYDIGIVPHLWFENSPVVLLEHLASGKPVLTSCLGGVPEFIREGETGMFFAAGDPESLAGLMIKTYHERKFSTPDEIQKTVPWSKRFFEKLKV